MTDAIVETVPLGSAEDFLAEHERRLKYAPSIGDVVALQDDHATRADTGALFTVTEIKTVPSGRNKGEITYSVARVGGGKGYRISGYGLRAATDLEKRKAEQTPTAARLVTGTVFTVPAGVLRGIDAGTPFVVIGENKDATVKAARLNGDSGRYFPKVPLAACTPVTATVQQ